MTIINMSDSDSETENFCFFGTPLEPYDEDSFPKKKPISIEDQIATDSHGRRRFHGAFTGGFSAGFFNTVGSLEGWTPREFKSTRQEKAESHVQKPEDFMDDEDLGEYGIAHQTVRATKEYSSSKKRRKQIFMDGPIPGEPVLHSLLTSGNETVGYLLLKNIGLQEKLQKYSETSASQSSEGRVYGCQMPKSYQISEDVVSNKQYEIPSIYREFLSNPKHNTFGLGYEGLDKSHLNLFKTADLVVNDKKKLSIRGQAFGVGAFEDEDDDIYVKDDMSRYDFEMGTERNSKKIEKKQSNLIFEKFVGIKTTATKKKVYPPPLIPHSFTGKHKVKRSRFEPLKEEQTEVKRGEINPFIRAKYLGESTSTESKPVITQNLENSVPNTNKQTDSQSNKSNFDLATALLSDRFVSSAQNDNVSNILEAVPKMETEHGTEQMRAAVKMKMFGALTRISIDWQPCSLLCKRFNVPEPFADRPDSSRKRTKNLIFEYQKHCEDQNNLKPGLSIQKTDCIEESQQIVAAPELDVKNQSELRSEDVIATTTSETQPETEGKNENTVDQTQPNIDPEPNIKEETDINENLSKDITEKVNIEEKIDLFKAVFLSSSDESDDEEEKNQEKLKQQEKEEENKRSEELKANILSEQVIPKIKPLREGILSNVNFRHAFSKPSNSSKSNEETTISNKEKSSINNEVPNDSKNEQGFIKEVSEDNTNLYGPKLPEKLPEKVSLSTNKVTVSSDSEDEWVEKDRKKDKKKKSKHKKEKKHKKDKHKKDKRDKK